MVAAAVAAVTEEVAEDVVEAEAAVEDTVGLIQHRWAADVVGRRGMSSSLLNPAGHFSIRFRHGL